MKRISFFSIILFAAAFVMTGCEKNEINYGVTEPVADKALLKFNYVSSYAVNRAVQLSINGERVSNLITSRTPFPGGGYNTGGGSSPDYLTVNPGTLDIKISIPKVGTNEDSVVYYTNTITVEANKNYTAHITDTAANTKTFLATDDFSLPDSGYVKYKFVNLMPNVPAVDLYYGTTKVASDIAYLTASEYFTMAVPTSSLTWSIRAAGAAPTSTALASYASASTTLNRRVYTAFALGYSGSTDAARKPYISFLLNR